MVFKEKLTWILDNKNHKSDDDEYQANIDFVHSLGKKCDCVGWSVLDMDEPDADKVLDKIDTFCKQNGWRARGWYERIYTDITSDWYELKTEDFKDNTIIDGLDVPCENGDKLFLAIISAYHELSHSPKDYHGICIPERFRNACIKNNISDVDFCWVQDKGRYEAEQYFYIYPHNSVPRIVYDKNLSKKNTSELQALGGYLPKIASVFYDLQHIDLPDCFLSEDMPSGGIVYVYCPSTYDFCGRHKVLIHKDIAETLINEKAISPSNLTPACVLDKCPEGYTLDKTETLSPPTREYIENSLVQYQKLKSKSRPEYIISEKEALKFLRKTKRGRKEEFNKKINKKYVENIMNSPCNSLLPYYQITDGGFLSDEYEFLSYVNSLKITEEFFTKLEKEELLETKPDGVVIATCANGDFVLFTKNEKIIRFSHETPDIVSEWQNPAQFFVDAINDN